MKLEIMKIKIYLNIYMIIIAIIIIYNNHNKLRND